MKRLVLLLLIVVALPGAALAQTADSALVIRPGEHIADSVATMSQDVRVEGVVDGDVTSWSGAITISGSVGGDVVSYAGTVTVMPGGRVGGHVLASGGELRVAPGAAVAGQAIRGEAGGDALASLLDLFAPIAGGGDSAFGRVLFGAVSGVLLLAFCLLYGAFWPRRMLIASATLQRLTMRALGLGLLTTIMLGLALPPLAAVLVASVIGVPVLLVLLALAAAVYVYGLAVLARWAGARVSRPRGRYDLSTAILAAAAALALAIAVVATLQPFYGLALFYLLASPGLGAAILSRGGMALPVAAP